MGVPRKMTDEQVVKAREMFATGKYRQCGIAEKFGVSGAYMSKLLIGAYRKEAGGPLHKPTRNGPQRQNRVVGDLTTLPMHKVAHLLQTLTHEWPNIREAFQTIDEVMQRLQFGD